jgi:hypothetical protein
MCLTSNLFISMLIYLLTSPRKLHKQIYVYPGCIASVYVACNSTHLAFSPGVLRSRVVATITLDARWQKDNGGGCQGISIGSTESHVTGWPVDKSSICAGATSANAVPGKSCASPWQEQLHAWFCHRVWLSTTPSVYILYRHLLYHRSLYQPPSFDALMSDRCID